MPTRLIREGILTSEPVNSLSWAEEVFYRRLLSVVDDFGRYYASPKLLRAACYPLHIDKVSDSDIGKWLAACATAALVRVYPAEDGKSYIEVQRFNQQVRAKASKFPQPQAIDSTCIADAKQVQADAHLDVSVFGVVSEDDKPAAPSGAELFEKEFWPAYPKKKAKDDALKAFLKRKPDRALLDLMLAAITWQRQTEDWVKEGGKFVPYPATWLNDGRWTDEKPTAMPTGAVSTVPGKAERDPELTRLDIERARAVPMPASVREAMAKLKQGAAA